MSCAESWVRREIERDTGEGGEGQKKKDGVLPVEKDVSGLKNWIGKESQP